MLDPLDAVALTLVPGITPVRVAGAIRDISPTTPGARRHLDQLLARAGVRHAARCAATLRDAAREAIARGALAGASPIAWGDTRYPACLKEIPDPPAVLWVRGDAVHLGRPAVAVVGSRAGSAYALEVAHRLASELAARGVTVVSGMARGVDGAAHKGALHAGGATIAVLGTGVDVAYPAEHRGLADAIVKAGALVSEFAPGTPPRDFRFPWRNRVISGLSLAVVVVEASERSGSLITARCAMEQGREVMAVPGNVLSERSRGSHRLLKDGAKLVEGVDDILEELRLTSPALAEREAAAAGTELRRGEPPGPLVPTGALLPRLRAGDTYDLDALVRLTGLEGPAILAALLELELQGSVTRAAGGWFVRSRGAC